MAVQSSGHLWKVEIIVVLDIGDVLGRDGGG